MDTHTRFQSHIDTLIRQSITLKAIAQKTGIKYNRMRSVYYPTGTGKASKQELAALEDAYRSELLLDYTKEERGLIEELKKLA